MRKGSFRKGTRSKTRRGHKNFETYKGSKRYSEKRFKRKFGRKTGRAPFFPFAGGMTKTQGKLDALDDVLGGSRMRHSYRHRRRRPHFRTHRLKKRSHFNRRRTRHHRKHNKSRKQKKSKGLFGFLFS